jgi:predicted nuclease of predicted toxin-antitoxin system
MKFLFDHDVPDDLAYALQASGHEVWLLRTMLPTTTPDNEILRFAGERDAVVVTCNRGDFLAAARGIRHAGLIVLIRRRSRAQERAALIRLLDQAGVTGIRSNINFA